MIHYKFKNCLQHDIIAFDGLNISVADLRKAIMADKKIGKASDFILQLTNAQTKEVYGKDDMLIPRNTSIIVARLPINPENKIKRVKPDLPLPIHDDVSRNIRFDRICKKADLVNANVTEGDKVQQMITQSTEDYDPSKFLKSRSMTGPVPATYICFHCGVSGHWNTNCPLNNSEVKRSKGIPQSFMVFVDGPQHKGALLTNSGKFAIPRVNLQAYEVVKKEKKPFVSDKVVPEPKAKIPEEIICNICKEILQEAVLIPCCGASFCDECIRHALLESDIHKCPDCSKTDISPDTLIPNRFLRTAVWKYKNKDGYIKKNKASLDNFSSEFPLCFTDSNSRSNLHTKCDLNQNKTKFLNDKSKVTSSLPLVNKSAEKPELEANLYQNIQKNVNAKLFSNTAEFQPIVDLQEFPVISMTEKGTLLSNSVQKSDESPDNKKFLEPQIASKVKHSWHSNRALSPYVTIHHKEVKLRSVVKCDQVSYLSAKEKYVFNSREDKISSKKSIDNRRSSRVHAKSDHPTKKTDGYRNFKDETKQKSYHRREKYSAKNVYDSDTHSDVERGKRRLKRRVSSEFITKEVSGKFLLSPQYHKKYSKTNEKYPKDSVNSLVNSENYSPDVYPSKCTRNKIVSDHERKHQRSEKHRHKRCAHNKSHH